MSGYFDHVRCQNCRSAVDPERLQGRLGPDGVASCPYCQGPIKLGDLFGLKASFAEEDEPDLSLDDLVGDSKSRPVWTGYGGTAPDPRRSPEDQPVPSWAQGNTSSKARRPAPPSQEEQPWRGGRGHVVPQSSEDDDDVEPGSALDVLRKLKRGR